MTGCQADFKNIKFLYWIQATQLLSGLAVQTKGFVTTGTTMAMGTTSGEETR